MPNSKQPETSTEAFRSLNLIKINDIHKRILEAMAVLKHGTYEDLSDFLHLEPQRVWRRLSELGKANLIHRPGERKTMKSGRQGMVWYLGPAPAAVKKKERVMKGKTVSEFSKALIQPKPNERILNLLF